MEQKSQTINYEILEEYIHEKQCISCQGRGFVIFVLPKQGNIALSGRPEMVQKQEKCRVCNGSGKVDLRSAKVKQIKTDITPIAVPSSVESK